MSLLRIPQGEIRASAIPTWNWRGRIGTYASFVKIEHTVFSLPLIFAGAWLGLRRAPSLHLAALLMLAAAGARAVGMGLNRLVDAELDARNPRTKHRELPRGAMTIGGAWGLIAAAGLLYVAASALIAPICLWLSPVPVLLFAGYPYLKRWTSLAHLGLGLAWSLAPVAGYLAATHTLRGISQVQGLWAFSLLWVAGFDVIYATMDEAFDRAEGLHSLPARLGKARALRIAALLHAMAFAALCGFWRGELGSASSFAWLMAVGAALLWEHAVASRRPEVAFFHLNAVIGFFVLLFVMAGI